MHPQIAQVFPPYRIAPEKMSARVLHDRKDQQIWSSPKENTPGTTTPSGSSILPSRSPISTIQSPPLFSLLTVPDITSKTTPRHLAQKEDWKTPGPPTAARALYLELYNASLPARSGSPDCYWPGRCRLHPCRWSPHRGCNVVCNNPYSRTIAGLAGRSFDEMMCKITCLVFTEDRNAGPGRRNRT